MLSSNREDDLLHKLKSCVGSLAGKSHPSVLPSAPAPSQNHSHQYQPQPPPQLPRKNEDFSRNEPLTMNKYQRSSLPLQKEANHFSRGIDENIYAGRTTIQIPQARTASVLQERKTENIMMDRKQSQRQKYSNRALLQKRENPIAKYNTERVTKTDIKREIRERYSPLKEPSSNIFPSKQNRTKSQYPSSYECSDSFKVQQHYPVTARKCSFGSIDRSTGQPPQPKGSAQPSFDCSLADEARDYKPSLRRGERLREERTQVGGERTKAGGEEGSALFKLKKISDLNEKINDRIRNIISVFEEHKC